VLLTRIRWAEPTSRAASASRAAEQARLFWLQASASAGGGLVLGRAGGRGGLTILCGVGRLLVHPPQVGHQGAAACWHAICICHCCVQAYQADDDRRRNGRHGGDAAGECNHGHASM